MLTHMESEGVTELDIISQLQEENLNLRKQICVLERLVANGSPLVDGLDDSLLATVIYHDIPTAKRRKVEQFIETLYNKVNESEIELDDDDEETYQSNCVSMYSGKCADQLYCTCQGRPMKLTGAVEYHEHFMFDLLGSPMVVRGDAFTLPDDLRIPYEQVYLQPFWVQRTELELREESRAKKFSIKCFNCGDDHHIKNCPQPYNGFNVARNKSLFQEAGVLGVDKRYYLEMESLERFAKFEPGKLSDKLKAALSLEGDEVPLYIIRMRELGYPPGWRLLKEETLKIFKDENEEDVYSKAVCEDIIFKGFNDKSVINESMVEDEDCLMPTNQSNDLGTLEDYEFDMEEEGGFVLRKLAKDNEEPPPLEDESPVQQQPARSLDFPPGLVDIANPLPPKRKWIDIFKIIERSRKN